MSFAFVTTLGTAISTYTGILTQTLSMLEVCCCAFCYHWVFRSGRTKVNALSSSNKQVSTGQAAHGQPHTAAVAVLQRSSIGHFQQPTSYTWQEQPV